EEACGTIFRSPADESPPAAPSALDPDPRNVPLVRNLLLMAGESRRRNGASVVVRLEERADELHRALADLAHLSAERIRALKLAAFAAGRGVRFELTNAPADVWLDADPRQLRHAVAAVARNGIEASPKGGWVRLGCEPAASGVAFVVEDSGPGLDEDTAEHAF